jgi:hypothetical protein
VITISPTPVDPLETLEPDVALAAQKVEKRICQIGRLERRLRRCCSALSDDLVALHEAASLPPWGPSNGGANDKTPAQPGHGIGQVGRDHCPAPTNDPARM